MEATALNQQRWQCVAALEQLGIDGGTRSIGEDALVLCGVGGVGLGLGDCRCCRLETLFLIIFVGVSDARAGGLIRLGGLGGRLVVLGER